MKDNYIRWKNKDLVFNETTNKCTLSFEVEALNCPIDDKGLIMLAIDALARIIEENDADPEIIFTETLKLGRLQ